jgi:hypothetical protein
VKTLEEKPLWGVRAIDGRREHFSYYYDPGMTKCGHSWRNGAFRPVSAITPTRKMLSRLRHMSRSAYFRNLAAPFPAVNITGGFADSNFRCHRSTTVTGPPGATGGHPCWFHINPSDLPGAGPKPGAGTGSAL